MYFLLLLIAITGYLVAEKVIHDRRLGRIRIRIHVNGTRGKSSVTELIAGALRRSGVRTLAKTTGTLPQLIFPDGTRQTLRRFGPANIIEQVWIIRRADRLAAEAIVIECMALDPVLQHSRTRCPGHRGCALLFLPRGGGGPEEHKSLPGWCG